AVYATVSLVLRFWATAIPLGDLLTLALAVMLLLGVLALAVVLIGNGLTMIRKEGRSLGNALSGLAGAALLAAPVVAFVAVGSLHPLGLGLGVLLGLLSLHLGTAFLIFFGASMLYQLFPRPLASDGIIVHGSQLIRGRVPALLRSRIHREGRERKMMWSRGVDPVLVPSEGKGSEEQRPVGEEMAEYLVNEAGVPAATVRAETASATTEENLIFSHRILDAAGRHEP